MNRPGDFTGDIACPHPLAKKCEWEHCGIGCCCDCPPTFAKEAEVGK